MAVPWDSIMTDTIKVVALSGNRLSGEMPRVESALDLQVLALDDNAFNGECPSYSGLPALRVLTLHSNNLGGKLVLADARLPTIGSNACADDGNWRAMDLDQSYMEEDFCSSEYNGPDEEDYKKSPEGMQCLRRSTFRYYWGAANCEEANRYGGVQGFLNGVPSWTWGGPKTPLCDRNSLVCQDRKAEQGVCLAARSMCQATCNMDPSYSCKSASAPLEVVTAFDNRFSCSIKANGDATTPLNADASLIIPGNDIRSTDINGDDIPE